MVIENIPLMGGLFMAGLMGGAGHCAGMCGPFVLSQAVTRLESVPAESMSEFHRLVGAALLPYHAGRATTYALLGGAAGWLSGGITQVSGWRGISAFLLGVAALIFAGYALQLLKVPLPWTGASRGEGWLSRRLGGLVRPLFAAPTGWRGYVLGLVLGMLPCGMLYGAIAAAAAGGSVAAAAVAMIAFTAGTFPALLGIGLAGHLAGRSWRSVVSRLAPVVLLFNAGFLGLMAWRLVP